jgi:hypothetical protein
MLNPQLSLILMEERLAVCKLAYNAAPPSWVSNVPFVSLTRTEDELSIVCLQDAVPKGVLCESGWRGFRVAGSLAFSMVGVLASLLNPLAEAGISVFVLSTFDTDYLLVKEENLDRAIGALELASHRIEGAP